MYCILTCVAKKLCKRISATEEFSEDVFRVSEVEVIEVTAEVEVVRSVIYKSFLAIIIVNLTFFFYKYKWQNVKGIFNCSNFLANY